ncbi:hypothetical protein HY041_01620 [Candidatus Roizmanbacteria bacterium]|nr:hypothetical protein [Candidatus Roizmanbacteria bacterium]
MSNKILLILVGAAVVGIGAYYFMNNQYKQPVMNPTGTPTIMISPTVSQTVVTGTLKAMNETTVTITASGFEPKSVKVKVGTKVVWVNKSGTDVSINSALHPSHLLYPPLNLGIVHNGDSVSLVFNMSGSYKYHDHLDASHTGVVVVE